MKELLDTNNDMSPNTVTYFNGNKSEITQRCQIKDRSQSNPSLLKSRATKLNILNSSAHRTANNTFTTSNNKSKAPASRLTTEGRKYNTNLKSLNSCNKIKFETPQLRNTIRNYKVNNLIQTFIQKISRNSIHRKPVVFQPFALDENQNGIGFNGLEFGLFIGNLIFLFSTFHTLFSCILASIIIPFSQKLGQSSFVSSFSFAGIILSSIQIMIGFTRVRYKKQSKIVKLKQISKSYLRQNFIIDFVSFCIYIINVASNNPHISLTYILFFIKIPGCTEGIKIIQSRILGTFQLQHYYKLFKIILSNFLFAHVIAIVMLLSSNIDSASNWLTKLHIQNTEWYEQYSWAYYWAMTTMLSVGFGDITVSNYKQALVLVIVQAFGCMTLAYNITCISSLLSALQSKQMEKNNNINLLRKFNNKNQLEAGIYKQLVNYIEESHKMEIKFNHQQSNNLINKLPQNLKSSFLRSVNQKSIKNLTFFKCLTNKTILSIAQKIQAKIAHPQQILCNRNQVINTMIVLKQGQVGLFPHMNRQIAGYGDYISDRLSPSFDYSKKYSSKIVNTVIDKFVVKEGEPTKFISLSFLKPNHKTTNCEIRSMKYSLIYQMSVNTLLNILRNRDIDIEYYFSIRDKYHGNPQQFQLIQCEVCSKNVKKQKKTISKENLFEQNARAQKQTVHKHTKFDCSRLHYIPLTQQIIFKHLNEVKKASCSRTQIIRTRKPNSGKNKSVLIHYRLYASVFSTFSEWFKTAQISQKSFDDNYNIYIPSQMTSRQKRLSTGISRRSTNQKQKLNLNSVTKNKKPRISINPNYESNCIKNMQTLELVDYMSQLDLVAKSVDLKNKLHTPSKFAASNQSLRPPTIFNQKLSNLVVQKQIPLEFWTVQSDSAYDFKFYMNSYNPKHLASNCTRTKNIITAKQISSQANF